jgi:hypothetical protein
MQTDPRDLFTEGEYEYGGLALAPCRHLVVQLNGKNVPEDVFLHLHDVPHWIRVDRTLARFAQYSEVIDNVLTRLAQQCTMRSIPVPPLPPGLKYD